MREQTIKNFLDELGSFEFNKEEIEEVKNYKLSEAYLDEATHILYSEEGIENLYDDMSFLFEDFIDDYPTVDDFKKYFTRLN